MEKRMGDPRGAGSGRTQTTCDYWVLRKGVLEAIPWVSWAWALTKTEGIKAPYYSKRI